jgi:molybdopterin converting factor subunit 1
VPTCSSTRCEHGSTNTRPASESEPRTRVCGNATAKVRELARAESPRYNPAVASTAQTIRVTVLFFGRLKDVAGHAEESFELAEGATIESLFAALASQNAELARFRASLVASRNQEFAAWNTPLRAHDEIAFLPPVSGG